MAGQLNIKDEALAHGLRRLARQDGRSVTATLRTLVTEEIRRREGDRAARLARMLAFSDQVHAALPDDVRRMTSAQVMDGLYGEREDDGLAR